VIFADDFVVLDEAHTVPEVATDNFGLSLSQLRRGSRPALSLQPPHPARVFRKLGGPEAQQEVVDALDASSSSSSLSMGA
jgi:ATP-dependent DNA helicase DinG